jgi:hypothetical protein
VHGTAQLNNYLLRLSGFNPRQPQAVGFAAMGLKMMIANNRT